MSTRLRVTEESSRVAVLTLDNPPVNYFDKDLIQQIADACDHAAARGVRAVVLRSAGRVFCAGADFGVAADADLDPVGLYRAGLGLFRRSIPLVASVNGAAVGGGAGLALAADLRVGTLNTRFAFNFAQLGIHHGFGISVTLPRVVGVQAAQDLLLTGRRIGGEEAHRLRLLDRLVDPEDLDRAAVDLAAEIASAAPLAIASIRRTLTGSLADDVAAAVEHEAREQAALFGTDDFREGVAAVAERRPGRFVGR